jgi:hypothetical protein
MHQPMMLRHRELVGSAWSSNSCALDVILNTTLRLRYYGAASTNENSYDEDIERAILQEVATRANRDLE